MKLSAFFENNPRIAVAFSGGADSSYLLYAAKTAGCDVSAYFVKSQFQPRFELNDALRIAGLLGIQLKVETLDVLSFRDIAGNPEDRCYLCKTQILGRIHKLARADGIGVLCDGTNADDSEYDRPGMRALRELGVISPLRECGITKAEIRALSREAGLPTYDKPPYACLATRVPAGTPISENILEKLEHAEEALMDMGFSDLRVRLLPPSGARIQLPEKQMETAVEKRADILAALRPGFDSIMLDLVSR